MAGQMMMVHAHASNQIKNKRIHTNANANRDTNGMTPKTNAYQTHVPKNAQHAKTHKTKIAKPNAKEQVANGREKITDVPAIL